MAHISRPLFRDAIGSKDAACEWSLASTTAAACGVSHGYSHDHAHSASVDTQNRQLIDTSKPAIS
jgi:hypothetical protein